MNIKDIFEDPNTKVVQNLIVNREEKGFGIDKTQDQTADAFSEKWAIVNDQQKYEELVKFQKQWYLKLYGFESEENLKKFLEKQEIILDAGCGLGYKAHWFAELSPRSTVIGMDISEAALIAKDKYQLPNLYFIRGDIGDTGIKPRSIDYVSCDQVIHHTTDPRKTMKHLAQIMKDSGEFAVYVYAKKALPRELLDEYFRSKSIELSHQELWQLSEQLTVLGKTLSELKIDIEVPDIPLLGIKGGKTDLQRFIYWNFIKCFWNDEMGFEQSVSTNFDWYSPSNAFRYSKEEFLEMADNSGIEPVFLHEEEACYCGRFKRK